MGIHPHETRCHVVIDGKTYPTIKTAYGQAIRMGFNGSFSCFWERVRDGRDTWASLLEPVSKFRHELASKGHSAKANKRQAERDEMAALIAEMDARKAAMTR